MMSQKVRLHITLDKHEQRNADNYTKEEFGLTLNQYISMTVKQFSKKYLEDERVNDELQTEIDRVVAGTATDLVTIKSATDFFQQLGLQ